jgi:probable selenate reductase FAD-binding subunit
MQFHSPATLAEAVALKTDLGEAAVYLAGGTEVNASEFPLKPAHLISLAGLTPNAVTSASGGIIMGAGCTIQALVESDEAPAVLRAAASHAAGRNIRNMATIGGHIAGHQPCAELSAVLMAFDAAVDLGETGTESSVPIRDYLADASRRLIVRVRIPRQPPARRLAVDRFARSAGDAAVVCVAVGLTVDSNRISDPIVAAAGLGGPSVRLAATEALLSGALPARESLERCVADEVNPVGDLRGSAEFKRRLAVTLVANAVTAAARGEGAPA